MFVDYETIRIFSPCARNLERSLLVSLFLSRASGTLLLGVIDWDARNGLDDMLEVNVKIPCSI